MQLHPLYPLQPRSCCSESLLAPSLFGENGQADDGTALLPSHQGLAAAGMPTEADGGGTRSFLQVTFEEGGVLPSPSFVLPVLIPGSPLAGATERLLFISERGEPGLGFPFLQLLLGEA